MRAASVVLCVLAVSSSSAAAAAVLFPAPLHLTRQVHDPISDQTTVLNEYGYGNRLITVKGSVTAIADYEKGELIQIDRDAGTYSVTRFDALARLAERSAPQMSAAPAESRVRAAVRGAAPAQTRSGRSAEFFEADVDAQQAVMVGVDPSVRLSQEALEVLIGAAYPSVRRPDHEVVFSAAAANRTQAASRASAGVASQSADSAAAGATYALPIELVIRYDIEGQKVEFKSSVVRVGSELPPAELVTIPAGARLIESRTNAVNRELDLIERPATTEQKP